MNTMASSVPLLMSFLSVVITAVILVHAGADPESPLPPSNKIIDGHPVDITAVPWQVALLTATYAFFCGGIIISDRWILTAAHCFEVCEPSDMIARVGSNAFDSGGQTYQILTGVHHEDHNSLNHNDIGALKTATAMDLGDSVGPKAIALPLQGAAPPPRGAVVFTSGWGSTSNTNKTKSSTLMGVQIAMVDFSECERDLPNWSPDESLELCAGQNGLSPCFGDSGGPLVRGSQLVGIVSTGDEWCGKYAQIYTKVSNYRDWIKDKTGV